MLGLEEQVQVFVFFFNLSDQVTLAYEEVLNALSASSVHNYCIKEYQTYQMYQVCIIYIYISIVHYIYIKCTLMYQVYIMCV